MKVIINGDDFGYDEAVNQAIADLISEEWITSTTILANGPAVEDAVRRIPSGSRCSFGVHLNLTEFEPLTPVKARGILHDCLDEKGCFRGESHLRSITIGADLREAFFAELRLQVEAVQKRGIHISHFDSHNHIHTLPGMFLVLKRLQAQFGVRKVRTTWNIFHPDNPPSRAHVWRKWLWDSVLRRYYKTTTTSGFTSFATFYEVAKLRRLNLDSVEVMVHPGHRSFQGETQLLSGDWQKEILFPISLISYNDL